ncbi:MAG TPA: biopolymer transporter ExbD [Dyella sp.]|nr:biopolymer transporter ExbD [Dyella sp.]
MAFSTGNSAGPMADINVTPLVDVMLVLLIIFMLTAPIVTHDVKIDLPQPTNNPPPDTDHLDPISLRIDASGSLYWNDVPVDESGMRAQMAVIAQQTNQPEIQINADDAVAYEYVARALSDAKSYGLTKIGFTEQ